MDRVHRRVGFFHDRPQDIQRLVARLIGKALVTGVDSKRRGDRWFTRVSLVRRDNWTTTAEYLESIRRMKTVSLRHFIRASPYNLATDEELSALPPGVLRRLRKDRRWFMVPDMPAGRLARFG